MMKHTIILLTALLFIGCEFLDKEPDDMKTDTMVWSNRNEVLKYLTNCYAALPMDGLHISDPWLGCSDECDITWSVYPTYGINQGNWNPSTAFYDKWATYYKAIRATFVFENNVDKCSELAPDLRNRYLGEALFLRGYYYFLLLRQYGPVVLLKQEMSNSMDFGNMPRTPFDECVTYVCELMDRAEKLLPMGYASGADELGRAKIDYDKCVSCGMCLVNCPFGAIADKSQIFQVIQSINQGDRVIAAVAPAFVGQFGPDMTPEKLKPSMKLLGFDDVVEVAIGADLCTIEEAKDFMREVPEQQPFMATSCCPAWSVMAKKLFPDFAPYISMAMTPMVLTARLLKKEHKNCKVVFIGPCAAKKLEASRRTIRSDVDFVLTFEEVMGMFEAKAIKFSEVAAGPELVEATADGRGFAVSGGVANAVVNAIHKMDPDREVKVMAAQGLQECKKMLMLAKAGKLNGYLLEGMACPGGCVAGAGTLQNPVKSTAALNKYKASAPEKYSVDSKYEITLNLLHD